MGLEVHTQDQEAPSPDQAAPVPHMAGTTGAEEGLQQVIQDTQRHGMP